MLAEAFQECEPLPLYSRVGTRPGLAGDAGAGRLCIRLSSDMLIELIETQANNLVGTGNFR